MLICLLCLQQGDYTFSGRPPVLGSCYAKLADELHDWLGDTDTEAATNFSIPGLIDVLDKLNVTNYTDVRAVLFGLAPELVLPPHLVSVRRVDSSGSVA